MCPFAILFICLHFGLRFMLGDCRYGSWFQICAFWSVSKKLCLSVELQAIDIKMVTADNFVFIEFKCIDGVSCTDVKKPSFCYLCFFPNWIWKMKIQMFPRVFQHKVRATKGKACQLGILLLFNIKDKHKKHSQKKIYFKKIFCFEQV